MPACLLLLMLLVPQSGEPVEAGHVPVPLVERPLRDAAYADLLAALGDDGVAGNAEMACRELLARGEEARPHLYARLSDDDPQRRFLAAWALAFVGPEDAQLELVSRTLIPVLGDDDVPGNGMMAGEALRALDTRARPWVMAALRYEKGDLRGQVARLAGDRYPYRRTTDFGQRARSVFLLGPSRSRDWAPRRLSPPADDRESRIRYVVQHLGMRPQWKAERFVTREIREQYGDQAWPYILEALSDPDRRVRHGAADYLRGWRSNRPPSPRLMEVLVEALSDDDIRGNAQRGTPYLVRHYAVARPWVLLSLSAPDPVVRYRAALVAAYGGERNLEAWVPPLVEALADDGMRGNALGATHVLSRLPQTRPWVQIARRSGDAQQRRLATRILALQRQPARRALPDSVYDVRYRVGDGEPPRH